MRLFSSLIYPTIFALLLPKVIASSPPLSPPLYESQPSHSRETHATSAQNHRKAGRYIFGAEILEDHAKIHAWNARTHAIERHFGASYQESREAERKKEQAKNFRKKALHLLTKNRQVARSA
jgi:hypothetical protein